jgi:hypothetical protein
VYKNLVLTHVSLHIYVLLFYNVPVQSVIFIYTRLYLKFKFQTIYYMLLHLYFETADLSWNFYAPSYVFFLKCYTQKCGIMTELCLENYAILMCWTFS